MTLEIGSTAPDFTLPADSGETLSLSTLLSDHAYIVLYFYPKDDTPGCTTEAKDFTALAGDFATLGGIVVGVSKDTPAKHDKFRAKHDLSVRLVSDEAGDMLEDYGVWVEKSMYGKTYMGIQRATYLIDSTSKIVASWPKVKVKGHAQAVLEEIQSRG